MAARERILWHLMAKKSDNLPEDQVEILTQICGLWGTSDKMGASDDLLLSSAMNFLSEKFKSIILKNVTADDICPICYDEIIGADLESYCDKEKFQIQKNSNDSCSTWILNCGHMFCKSCLIAVGSVCPICRHEPVEIRSLPDVLKSASLQANILKSFEVQLEAFSPTPALPAKIVPWNWYSKSPLPNLEMIWRNPPTQDLFRPFSENLSTQIQAADELGISTILLTNVANKPCFYFVDPTRQFQLKVILDYSKQRSLVLQGNKFVARADDGSNYVYSEEIQEKILQAQSLHLRIIPVSVPQILLWPNSFQNWSCLYTTSFSEGEPEGGYCVDVGLMKQVPFRFEKSSDGLILMRMIKAGELP